MNPNTSDGGPAASVGRETVIRDELAEIARRREQAFRSKSSTDEDIKSTLVGLSLSGGGVRSGAFGLGVMQALYQNKLLPFVDYVSTVSGGGYAGAYLASEALRSPISRTLAHGEPHPPFEPAGTAFERFACEQDSSTDEASAKPQPKHAEPAGDASQSRTAAASNDTTGDDAQERADAARSANSRLNPSRLLQFIHGGHYLMRPWAFSSRHVIGWLLILTTLMSGLVCVASFTAWSFRQLDHQSVRYWLEPLGFRGDLPVAFFPAAVLLVVWLITWMFSYIVYRESAVGVVARGVFLGLVYTTLVGVALLVGAGDIGIVSGVKSTQSADDSSGGEASSSLESARSSASDKVTSFKDKMKYLFISAILAGLLPYLNPKRLFRSGTAADASFFERVAFKIASVALLVGLPFGAIAWFAQENFSSWNDARTGAFQEKSEIAGWGTTWTLFWQQVMAESRADYGPGKHLWRLGVTTEFSKDGSRLPFKADGHRHTEQITMDEAFKRLSDRTEALKKSGFADSRVVRSWLALLDYGLHRWPLGYEPEELDRDNSLKRFVMAKRELDERKTEIVHALNGAPVWQEMHSALLLAASATQPGSVFQRSVAATSVLAGVHEMRTPGLNSPVFYRQFESRFRSVSDSKSAGALAAGLGADSAIIKKVDDSLVRSDLVALRAEARALDQRIARTGGRPWPEREILQVNRKLLESYYKNDLRPKATFVSTTVVIQKDQEARWTWMVGSLIVFVLACVFVDLNATSWHGFYSKQIAEMWLQPVPGLARHIPLAQLETTDRGAPYHLISGTVQFEGRREGACQSLPRDIFLFSKLYFGSESTGFGRSRDFESSVLTLANAVAVSGAAVSPMQYRQGLVRFLLVLGNVRLGQWVANPGFRSLLLPEWLHRFLLNWPVTPLRILLPSWRLAERRPFCFVTDGGHFENLGIDPLLRRRCRLIIAADASCDGNYKFLDLDNLIRWADVNHSIKIEFLGKPTGQVLDDLVPPCKRESAGKTTSSDSASQKRKSHDAATAAANSANASTESDAYSHSHFLIAKITYPEKGAEPAYLVYMKSSLTGDEPRELIGFKESNPQFPHDETADQFFEPERFVSYMQLGFHVAEKVCEPLRKLFNDCRVEIKSAQPGADWSTREKYKELIDVVARVERTKIEPTGRATLTSAAMAGGAAATGATEPGPVPDVPVIADMLGSAAAASVQPTQSIAELLRIVQDQDADAWRRKGEAIELGDRYRRGDVDAAAIIATFARLLVDENTDDDVVQGAAFGLVEVGSDSLDRLRAVVDAADSAVAVNRSLAVMRDIFVAGVQPDSATLQVVDRLLHRKIGRSKQTATHALEILSLYCEVPHDTRRQLDPLGELPKLLEWLAKQHPHRKVRKEAARLLAAT